MMFAMKNKFLFLFPLILASLVGCNTQKKDTKDTKVFLSYGSRYDTEATALSDKQVEDKINNEESFLLALHPGAEEKVTCSCWKTFSYLIDEYVKDSDRIIYKIDVYKMEKYGLEAPENQDPGFAVFENGKLKKQYVYTVKNTPTYFTNKDALKGFLNDISVSPKMIYINDEQYQKMLFLKESFALSIVRKGCGDCNYVLPNIFDPFFKNNETNQNLYLLDIEDLDHYHKDTDEEKRVYQDYKDSLLLSDYEYDEDGNPILEEPINPLYGYSTGVVPTTFIYEDGKIIDGNVFFNDSVGVNEDGTYYISQSYFTSERVNNLKYTDVVLEGKTLGEDEIAKYGEFIYLPSASAAKYHTPILESFLNYYFK